MCPLAVDSVRKLVLDDSADFSLEVSSFIDAQAGVDILASGQLKVVHLSVPWFGVSFGRGVSMPYWWRAVNPYSGDFWKVEQHSEDGPVVLPSSPSAVHPRRFLSASGDF